MLISGSPVGQSVGPSIHRLVVWKAWFFPLLLRVGDGCPRVEAHFESFIACMSFWLFVCPMMEDRVGELNDGLLKFFWWMVRVIYQRLNFIKKTSANYVKVFKTGCLVYLDENT